MHRTLTYNQTNLSIGGGLLENFSVSLSFCRCWKSSTNSSRTTNLGELSLVFLTFGAHYFPCHHTGNYVNSLALFVGMFVYIYIYISEMVPTWSEALRGLWGNRAGKNKEKGETSSQSPTMVELLNEKTAQMEKEM
jgi:hypothetical protein